MSSLHGYTFNNLGGLRADMTDQTQQNIQNTRFGNYTVSNFYSNNTSDSQLQFAIQQPGFLVHNGGISSSVIDIESNLFTKMENERAYEKLQLFQRPFLTVPYLGRGAGDPTLEAQLQQGEMVRDLKSVATISEKNYMDTSQYPMREDLRATITNPANLVQELAMDGWVRGGVSARESLNVKK